MNKTDLIKEISEQTGLKPGVTETLVNNLIEAVSQELKNGGSVTLVGFGTFKIMDRKARNGIVPKTGEKIKIQAKKVPKFVPGKALKEAVK